MARESRGIHELYSHDPAGADRRLWGRIVNPVTRRGFVLGSGVAAMSAAVGAAIPFAEWMPGGLIPAALAQTADQFSVPGKDGLRVLNDRPLNAETPAHLLDDEVTPTERLFVRNNGTPPLTGDIDPLDWGVDVAGESCIRPRGFTLRELQEGFEHHSLQLQLECGGNGRVEFHPPARGNQWSTGAVGCPVWTGVRLKDVLERCGVADDRGVRGLRGGRPACLGRRVETADLARRAGAQGNGGRVADRLGHERRTVAAAARISGASGYSGAGPGPSAASG